MSYYRQIQGRCIPLVVPRHHAQMFSQGSSEYSLGMFVLSFVLDAHVLLDDVPLRSRIDERGVHQFEVMFGEIRRPACPSLTQPTDYYFGIGNTNLLNMVWQGVPGRPPIGSDTVPGLVHLVHGVRLRLAVPPLRGCKKFAGQAPKIRITTRRGLKNALTCRERPARRSSSQ